MKDLNWWLESTDVIEVDLEHRLINKGFDNLNTWYYFANEEGVTAYFRDEKDALSFRLNYINNKLNS